MREPRTSQRFPAGGQRLYELMRSDHEPECIDVFRRGEVSAQRAAMPDTLVYEPDFDPVVYFWPVHRCFVHVHLEQPAPEQMMRLTQALLRDGACWIVIACRREWGGFQFQQIGDGESYVRERYGAAAVDALGSPGEGSGADRPGVGEEGQDAVRGVADWVGEDDPGLRGDPA